ncbi:MAG TPA: HAD family hydrolase [Bacillota bacterium]
MTASPPVLLLFDIDGTLLRVPAGRRAYRRALKELLDVDDADRDFDFSGGTDRLAFRELARRCRAEDVDVDALIARYVAYLERELEVDPGLCLPGADRFTAACAADPRYRLALGTGNVQAGARAKLRAHDLDRYFPTGGFGDDADERADILRVAVDRAEECYGERFGRVIVIGDTPLDVAAARAVGAAVLAVATGRPSAEELAAAAPDALLPDLADTVRAHEVLGALARGGSPV